MMIPPDGRSLLISALLIIALVVGCKDQSEPEVPQKPPGLRKKISTPIKPVSKAEKPKREVSVTPPRAQVDVKEEKETIVAVEPSTPDKRDLVEPKKSDYLALAEGLTKRPEYFYDPRGKHDPFESLFETETEHVGVAPRGRESRKKECPLPHFKGFL